MCVKAGPCNSGILVCGPPTITIFGGDGIGGLANAVINRSGNIIGAQVLDGGFGYTQEPYVVIKDACGNGRVVKVVQLLGQTVRLSESSLILKDMDITTISEK